jgi:Putative esterase
MESCPRKLVLALLCIWLALSASGGEAGLTVSNQRTDPNGVIWYDATSPHNGPGATTLRVLPPTKPPSGLPRLILYVLPVIAGVNFQDEFGDGLEELRRLNVHNDYNAYIVAPSFKTTPWYADHDSNPDRRYESFLVQDLVPWVWANLSASSQEEHWLVGFSKSGFGALSLIFRNPMVFDAAIAWDVPANRPNAEDWSMLDNYGTENNFQNNYRLTADFVSAHKEQFRAATRLWLSLDFATHRGKPTFGEQMSALTRRFRDQGVQYMLGRRAERIHTWGSGWLPHGIAALHSRRYITTQHELQRTVSEVQSTAKPEKLLLGTISKN